MDDYTKMIAEVIAHTRADLEALIAAHAGIIHRILVEAEITTPEHIASVVDLVGGRAEREAVQSSLASVAETLRSLGGPGLTVITGGASPDGD